MVVAPTSLAADGLGLVKVVVVVVVVEAVHDALAEGQMSESVEEEGPLPPEVADRGEEPTWVAMADCDSEGLPATPCGRTLGESKAERVETWMAELADHGPTCSRNLVAA